jgi:hypothetical protein
MVFAALSIHCMEISATARETGMWASSCDAPDEATKTKKFSSQKGRGFQLREVQRLYDTCGG